MTWSRFDDAAPTHPKAREAGNEAWGLWCAAVMYCNRYLTDGFVSVKALARDCLPVPIKEEKAKKLAKLLVDAKVKPDGRGLFTETEGGYIVNDFLEWNPSKSDVESKRKADRERKRSPGGVAKDSERNPTGRHPDSNGSPSGGQVDSGGASPARGPAPAGARPPSPSIPDHSHPPQPAPEATAAARGTCPPGLALSLAQRATLETSLIPGYAIDAVTAAYVAKYVGNPNECRSLDEWARGLVTAITATWNGDPRRRPRPPEKSQAAVENDGFGPAEEWAV